MNESNTHYEAGEAELQPPPEQISDAKAEAPTTARRKQLPAKTLPTERVGFEKQMAALNAYASVHDSTKAPVSNADVGKIIKLNPTTTALMNAFFVDTGLLQKAEGGFLPSDEVKAFALARQWEEEFPGHKLRPLLSTTWFSQALLPHLKVGAKGEKETLTILATTASAEPAYRPHLRILLNYLETAGLIEREGGVVRAALLARETTTQPPPPAANREAEVKPPTGGPTTSWTVELLSGGTLTLVGTFDPFALSPTDREFVFKHLDGLRDYQKLSEQRPEEEE